MLKPAVRLLIRTAKGVSRRFPALQKLRYDLFNQDVFSGLDWHERMLIDSVRVEAYQAGIASAVKHGDVVIDLGTGTGILATFAARAGARQVYAIDHSTFIDVARQIAAHNGLTNITFVQTNSRDFTAPEPADLIVHEQMGHTIFDENMIQNLLDLKRRALKPGGRIVPGRFELCATPVALKDEYRRPFLWQTHVPGFDVGFLERHPSLAAYQTQEHRQRLLKGFEVESFLAPTQSLLRFDINDIAAESDLATTHDVRWEINSDGVIDGICFHFRTQFDDGTTFDTSPFSRQTNWENALIRTSRVPVTAGDTLAHTIRIEPLTNWSRWQVLAAGTQARA